VEPCAVCRTDLHVIDGELPQAAYPIVPGHGVVGIVEAFSSFYASNYKEVIVFMLLIPVLLLRSLAAPAVEEEKD